MCTTLGSYLCFNNDANNGGDLLASFKAISNSSGVLNSFKKNKKK